MLFEECINSRFALELSIALFDLVQLSVELLNFLIPCINLLVIGDILEFEALT